MEYITEKNRIYVVENGVEVGEVTFPEGADVHVSFGFAGLDLRDADLRDGAVISVDCSFGGMEIRVPKGVCVNNGIDATFAGVDCDCCTQPSDGATTLYLKGRCNFGGIELK